MVTEEIFEKLKTLQEILKEKYDLQAKIEDAPKLVSNSEQALAKSKKEYIAKNEGYDALKATVSELKFSLDEAVRSRESGEKGMDNITTHREFEALEKQIAEASDRENEIRKELQKQEKTLEEINEDLKRRESELQFSEEELTKSREQLESQLAEYNAQLAELQAQEDEITPDLDKEILFKVERIIQRNTKGIVAVRYNKDAKGHVCTGCNMVLPHQFANVVREGESIIFCPYCSRILDFEETENEDKEEYYSIDDLGSLTDDDDEESQKDDDDSLIDEDTDDQNTSYDEDSLDSLDDDYDDDDMGDSEDDEADEEEEEEDEE